MCALCLCADRRGVGGAGGTLLVNIVLFKGIRLCV